MKEAKGKKTLKALYTKIFEKNISIFSWFEYMYTGSLVLFWWLPAWKKIPDDIDVAINRDNKEIKDLEVLCTRIENTPEASGLKIRTVFEKKYTINKKIYQVKKYEKIDKKTIDKDLLKALLNAGNIRISYHIYDMIIEIFPEKNGTGLRNLWNMSEIMQYEKIKTDHKTEIIIPFQRYITTAQWYAMNFLKEIVRNNIYRFTDQGSKPKDGIRLFTIISLLEKEEEDASPTGILKFIKKTVATYSKIPQSKRSLYVDSAINEFPWIEKMLKRIIKEYTALIKQNNVKSRKFIWFYKKLGEYKKELNTYSNYLEKDMLWLLKKDILGEKYIITDAVAAFSNKGEFYDKAKIKEISKNIKKISQSIEHIWFKNKNESFAYFYEMYMFKNLFIKPIEKIL